MNIVKIRDLTLGEGKPKICVPIVGRTKEEIALRAGELLKADPDLAEWRADWYENALEEESLQNMLRFLRGELGGLPLLVTFRTKQEGGERELTLGEYQWFLRQVLASGQADLLDVELSKGIALLEDTCEEAHRAGMYVAASSHDFGGTPEKEEIIRRLRMMQECGADLLKLAAMPKDAQDVLTLLGATQEMKEKYAKQPLITMSMGGLGLISRLSGEVFGSAVTFGAAGMASAPGQLGVPELKMTLDVIHRNGFSA